MMHYYNDTHPKLEKINVTNEERGYKSQFSGMGQPEFILGTTVTSKQSRLFNQFSTASPFAYRIDSFKEISFKTLLAELLADSVDSFFTEGALCARNCSISFKDKDRPVPSYLNEKNYVILYIYI